MQIAQAAFRGAHVGRFVYIKCTELFGKPTLVFLFIFDKAVVCAV